MKPLKEEKVIEICKLIARKDITLREISKLMRVSSVTIRHILNRKKYTEYSKEYSFMHRITALHLTPGLGERVVRLLETERYYFQILQIMWVQTLKSLQESNLNEERHMCRYHKSMS